MNKFLNYIFALTAIVALGFMSSCSDDDETPGLNGPSISLSTVDGENESDFTGYVGDSVGWTITVNAPVGFNTLNIYRQEAGVKGSPIKVFSKVSGTTPTSFEEDYGYRIKSDDVNSTVYIVFEAVDEEGRIATLDYEINAEVRPTRQFTTKLLYAPNANLSSKTFFSTFDGETYSVNDVESTSESVSSKIDFGFYFRNNNQHTLSSPAAYPSDIPGHNLESWETKNATLIRTTNVTATQFLEFQNDVDFINKAFDEGEVDSEGSNPGRVTHLVEGQILAFELAENRDGKRGLIKIVDIVGSTGLNDYIEIDVVVVD